MEAQVATNGRAPRPYAGFEGQYIDGSWRPSRQGGKLKDTDPYTGETLTEIIMADENDLDEAYQSAAKAQVEWAAFLPSKRAAVMVRSAAIIEARRQEIVDWIIRESGSSAGPMGRFRPA